MLHATIAIQSGVIWEVTNVKKVISFLLAVTMLMTACGVMAEEEQVAAPASVTVIKNTAGHYFGDTVMLRAAVKNAEISSEIRWEVAPGYLSGATDNWQPIGSGEHVYILLTPSAVSSGFRCIMPTGEVSPVYVFSGITEAPAEEIVIEEPAEEIAEEVTTEETSEENTEEVITEEAAEEIAEEVIPEEAAEEIAEEVIPEEAAEEIAEEKNRKSPKRKVLPMNPMKNLILMQP